MRDGWLPSAFSTATLPRIFFIFPPSSQQPAQRAEVQVQVLVLKAELLLELLHALLEQHEGAVEALDLLVGQPAGVDAAQRLTLHQLAQELDDRQHELGEALLDALGVCVDAARQRVGRVALREPRGRARRNEDLIAEPIHQLRPSVKEYGGQ